MRGWLRNLRETDGMTQEKLAEKLGISRVYYGFIENGTRQQKMDIEVVQKLSKIFDVTVDWIIEQENLLKGAE